MLGTDIQITRILNVYFSTTNTWTRPRMLPRGVHGVVLLTDGSITYHFHEKTLVAEPGDILAFPRGLYYSGEVNTPTQSFYVVDFETDPPDAFEALGLARTLRGQEALEAHFVRMERLWREEGMAAPLLCKSDLYAILARLVEAAAHPGRPNERTEAVAAYIREHYQEPSLTVCVLARRFGLSPSQLRRDFAKELGVSPAQYIMGLRLQLAKNLLMYEDYSVKEVAFRCGFGSEYYFSRLFKEKVGVPPSKYQ